jgi:NitT/TauT family transport system permease protein
VSESDPRGYRPGELHELLEPPEGRGGPRSVAYRTVRQFLPGAVALGALAAIWQLVAVNSPNAFATLGAIWSAFWGNLSMLGLDTAVTLEEVAVGLAISFAVAFGLAVAMTYFEVVERAVMPVAVILNVTPIVAIAPGLTILLGLGMSSRFVVTALIVFFPLLVNSLVGLGSVEPDALDVFRTLAASRREVLLRLRIPSSLPYLFVAARICFPLATVGAVVAEFSTSGTEHGLGYEITNAVSNSAFAIAYAAIACLAIVGLALTALITLVERRVLAWHPGGRRRARLR